MIKVGGDWTLQLELMRSHWELAKLLKMLEDDGKDPQLRGQLSVTMQLLQKRFHPEIKENPLIGWYPGTKEWDKQVDHIIRTVITLEYDNPTN